MPNPTDHPEGAPRCGDQLCPRCYPPAERSPEPGQLDTLLGVPTPPERS